MANGAAIFTCCRPVLEVRWVFSGLRSTKKESACTAQPLLIPSDIPLATVASDCRTGTWFVWPSESNFERQSQFISPFHLSASDGEWLKLAEYFRERSIASTVWCFE